jgi:hypothetical protein
VMPHSPSGTRRLAKSFTHDARTRADAAQAGRLQGVFEFRGYVVRLDEVRGEAGYGVAVICSRRMSPWPAWRAKSSVRSR